MSYDPTPTTGGTVMDDVRNQMCSEYSEGRENCFMDNRATLHLHGGITPWISDGTPHQWITPANENTPYPEGVSVEPVPDMIGQAASAGVPDCSAPGDGCMSFYYTNQQSARLMFYHDHAWGITRLNVYAGEAAGYLIQMKPNRRWLPMGSSLLTRFRWSSRTAPSCRMHASSLPLARPNLGPSPLGQQGQPVVPARLHASPKSERPERHERLWALDVWSLVLAAVNDSKYQPIDNPYYRPDL